MRIYIGVYQRHQITPRDLSRPPFRLATSGELILGHRASNAEFGGDGDGL